MMKKTLLITAVLAVTLSAAACSQNQAPVETTVAATEATTEATTEETTEEEVEEDYMSGIITKIDGDILTVKDDNNDQLEKNYDISAAEMINDFPLSEGDWVDITFPYETTEDPIPVMILEVTESVIGANTDSSVEGNVVDATMNTITLDIDGENVSFGTPNAYIVAQNGITVDSDATVTYIGDLDDGPIAVKVVMADSYDTPEAEINAFIGDVAQISEDVNGIVLVADNGDFFTFVSDDIDFEQYTVGETLEVEYTGTITAKEIPIVEIIKK